MRPGSCCVKSALDGWSRPCCAGLSTTAASWVLNGREGTRLSDDARGACSRRPRSTIRGALDAARERDHVLLIAETQGDPALERDAIDAMLHRQVDGIIYAAKPTGRTWASRPGPTEKSSIASTPASTSVTKVVWGRHRRSSPPTPSAHSGEGRQVGHQGTG